MSITQKKEYYKEKTIDASGSIEYNEAHWKKDGGGWVGNLFPNGIQICAKVSITTK